MASKPRVYYRLAAADDFPGLVDALADNLDYVLYERPDDVCLTVYTRPDPSWIQGRAFGKALEVRWTQIKDGCELQVLTEAELALTGWALIPWNELHGHTADVEAESTQMLLWGTHRRDLPSTHRLQNAEAIADEWIETRIPRPLHYPVADGPKHVALRAMIYRVGGQPVLTRLVAVEPYTEVGGAE
jgi:hypothetical protein